MRLINCGFTQGRLITVITPTLATHPDRPANKRTRGAGVSRLFRARKSMGSSKETRGHVTVPTATRAVPPAIHATKNIPVPNALTRLKPL